MGRLVLAMLGLASACARSDDGVHTLTGSQIEALFADKTVHGHHEVHDYDFRSYYAPTGTFRSHQTGRTEPRSAQWYVAGDDICVVWDDAPGTLCRGIVERDGRYFKVVDTERGAKTVVTFHRFAPGNPDDL